MMIAQWLEDARLAAAEMIEDQVQRCPGSRFVFVMPLSAGGRHQPEQEEIFLSGGFGHLDRRAAA
jgi:hypothetical protein